MSTPKRVPMKPTTRVGIYFPDRGVVRVLAECATKESADDLVYYPPGETPTHKVVIVTFGPGTTIRVPKYRHTRRTPPKGRAK